MSKNDSSTFRMYILLNENGSPETIVSGDNRCVCVFTDLAFVETFYKDKYGAKYSFGDFAEFDVMEFESRPHLVDFFVKSNRNLCNRMFCISRWIRLQVLRFN